MNKLKFYLKYSCYYLIWGLTSFSMNVSATTHNDAVADIMNDDRFQGAIASIEWLTSRVDHWFTMIITATAFFIISAAMLKNVCAGAYCSNSKLWDKVDEAHKKKEGTAFMSYITGLKDNVQNLSAGGIKDALLSLFPNIKAFTDFEDAAMEPKHYWMKAIPQMLACIIIGVFIYNGYYRDTASLVGSFGSAVCDRIFSSVDANSFVDYLTQTTSTPPNIFEADQSIAGKIELEFSSSLYKAYLSAAKGESSSTFKTSLMRDCENAAQTMFNTNLSSSGSGLGAQYNIDSASRLYDYSISGLTIMTVPASTVATKSTFTIDKNEDNSELYVTGYGAAPASISGYLTDATANAYYYYTFTLKGKKSDGSSAGKSNIVAEMGNWQSSEIAGIAVSVNIKDLNPTKDTSGKAKAGVNSYDVSSVSGLDDTSLLNHINTSTGKSYTSPSVTWSGTSGQKAAFNVRGKGVGDATTLTANVTVTDTESGNKVTFDIPVTLTIT